MTLEFHCNPGSPGLGVKLFKFASLLNIHINPIVSDAVNIRLKKYENKASLQQGRLANIEKCKTFANVAIRVILELYFKKIDCKCCNQGYSGALFVNKAGPSPKIKKNLIANVAIRVILEVYL